MDLLWVLGYRSRGYRRRRAQVEAAIASGDVPGAIDLLREQERAWSGNWTNGSRKSELVDVDHLLWVLTTLLTLSPHPSLERVHRAAQDFRNFIADRTNFGMDGRMMKREPAILLDKIHDELAAARKAMRVAIESRM